MKKKSSDLNSIRNKIDKLSIPKGRFISGKKLKEVDDLLFKMFMQISSFHRDADEKNKYGFVLTKKEIDHIYGKECPVCQYVEINEKVREVLGID